MVFWVNNLVFSVMALLLLVNLVSCDNSAEQAEQAEQAGSAIVVPDGIMAKGASWELIDSEHLYTDSPAADRDGNIYFAEGKINSSGVLISRIVKLDADQRPEVFTAGRAVRQGLVFGSDRYLYACSPQEAQIVRYSPDGTYEVLAQGDIASPTNPSVALKKGVTGVQFCNDLAVSADGGVWFTDRNGEQVFYASPEGEIRAVASGFRCNGILLSLDKKMLVVTDSREPKLHAFRVGENGSLDEIPDFFDPLKLSERNPEVPGGAGGAELSAGGAEGATGANGMALDSEGRFYVTTFLGVQILDKDGHHVGTIPGAGGYVSNLGFGGADRKWLYSTGTQLSRLRMEAQGVIP